MPTNVGHFALLAEVLPAGLTGCQSLFHAGRFRTGGEFPGGGIVDFALSPARYAPRFPVCCCAQLDRLVTLGLHVSGQKRPPESTVEVDLALIVQLQAPCCGIRDVAAEAMQFQASGWDIANGKVIGNLGASVDAINSKGNHLNTRAVHMGKRGPARSMSAKLKATATATANGSARLRHPTRYPRILTSDEACLQA